MSKPEPICVVDARVRVAESPVWSPEEQVLYWADIYGCRLHRYDPANGQDKFLQLPSPLGTFALAKGGGFVVALKTGIHRLDAASGALTLLAEPEPDMPENRLNDGRCDRAGRFWVGSMLDPQDPAKATGSIYRFDGHSVARMTDGIRTSNGIAFGADDRTFYHCDTSPASRTIWAWDFDLAEGTIRNRRVFLDTTGMPGRPDGAAVDADGCYWFAATDGAEIIRMTPAGRIDRRVALPVKKPSMLCFGGSDLKTIYVTSVRTPQSDETGEPAGGVLALEQDIQGLPEPRFAF